jgi:vacuolar-type H+-ATPase catalytic subunit A/Vma1
VDDKGNTVYSMGKKVTKTTHKTESITEEKLKDQAYDKVDSIACGLKESKTMKELLGVYNENKTQIEITPELKSIFKEVKKAIIDKM